MLSILEKTLQSYTTCTFERYNIPTYIFKNKQAMKRLRTDYNHLHDKNL